MRPLANAVRCRLLQPRAAPSDSQLQTGWLFGSRDEEDASSRASASPSSASTSASSSADASSRARSAAMLPALLPILVPLSAAAVFFAAKGLDVPVGAYLPTQLTQLESILPKPSSLQAALPKGAAPAPSGYLSLR